MIPYGTSNFLAKRLRLRMRDPVLAPRIPSVFECRRRRLLIWCSRQESNLHLFAFKAEPLPIGLREHESVLQQSLSGVRISTCTGISAGFQAVVWSFETTPLRCSRMRES